HRELADLAADGARNVFNLDDLLWDVQRRRVLAQLIDDLVAQILIERRARPQLDKQNDSHVARRTAVDLLPYRDTLQHFRQLLYLPIDLGGANPHSAWI